MRYLELKRHPRRAVLGAFKPSCRGDRIPSHKTSSNIIHMMKLCPQLHDVENKLSEPQAPPRSRIPVFSCSTPHGVKKEPMYWVQARSAAHSHGCIILSVLLIQSSSRLPWRAASVRQALEEGNLTDTRCFCNARFLPKPHRNPLATSQRIPLIAPSSELFVLVLHVIHRRLEVQKRSQPRRFPRVALLRFPSNLASIRFSLSRNWHFGADKMQLLRQSWIGTPCFGSRTALSTFDATNIGGWLQIAAVRGLDLTISFFLTLPAYFFWSIIGDKNTRAIWDIVTLQGMANRMPRCELTSPVWPARVCSS